MVRVPVQILPQEQQQVGQPTQLQSQRAVPFQDYGAQQQQRFGAAIQDLGVVAMRLGQKAQDEFDTAQIKKGENQLVQSMQRRLYDPRTGYLNTTGEAATGDNRTKVFDDMRAEMDAIEKGLANDTQRRLFREAAEDRMLRAQGLADAHESREIRSQSIGASDTRQGLAINDALATYGDGTNNFAKFYALVKQEANDKADLLGIPQDPQDPQRRALELDATTKLHNGVARKLLNSGKAAEAKGYLAGVSGEVAASVMSDLQRDIDIKLKQDTNENIAAEVIAQADAEAMEDGKKPARPAELMSRTSKLLAGRKDLPEGSSDDIMRLVRSESAIRAAVIDENTVGVRNEAQKWMRDNPNAPLSRMPLWMQTGITEYGLLDETTRFAENMRTVTDPTAYAEAMRAAETGDLADMTLLQVRSRWGGSLSPSRMAHVEAMRAHLRGEATAAQKQLISVKDIIKNKAKDLHIIPETGEWSDEESISFRKWEDAAQKEIDALGHEASPEEARVIADRVAMDNRFGRNLTPEEILEDPDAARPFITMTAEERLDESVTLADGSTVPYRSFVADEVIIRQGIVWRSYLNRLPSDEAVRLERLATKHREDMPKILQELPPQERERLERALARGMPAVTRAQVAEMWMRNERGKGRQLKYPADGIPDFLQSPIK